MASALAHRRAREAQTASDRERTVVEELMALTRLVWRRISGAAGLRIRLSS